jgi:cytochrome c oxidase subunit IV
MSEFHDDYPSYETLAHHSEEDGKKIRKTLWLVFWFLLAVTIIEVVVGLKAEDWELSKMFLMIFFIGFTIIKAAGIVYVFMHLKDETRTKRMMLLYPFTGFIVYLIVMMTMGEGNYSAKHRLDIPVHHEQAVMNGDKMEPIHSGNHAPAANEHKGEHH